MTKELYLIRHAEGFHNPDCQFHLFDPKLTPRGEQQTIAAREALDGVEFDHLIVSPLRRTLQTAALIFDSRPMRASELVREHVQHPCDLRPDLAESRSLFPQVDFSFAPEKDPHRTGPRIDDFAREGPDEVLERCRLAMEFFRSLEGSKIAVVSHFGFISHFHKALTGQKVYLENCQVLRLEMP
jgi:broad specificity phosphatase PhoE